MKLFVDESNFDDGGNRYFQEALAAKKWAFASDYARLKVLIEHGGVYMDTDVEVLRPWIASSPTGLFPVSRRRTEYPRESCVRGKPSAVRATPSGYDNRRFLKANGQFDLTTNVTYITEALLAAGLVLNNQKQTVAGFTLYPSDFFCPKDWLTGNMNITDNTCTIHHSTAPGRLVGRDSRTVSCALSAGGVSRFKQVKRLLRGENG